MEHITEVLKDAGIAIALIIALAITVNFLGMWVSKPPKR